MPAPWWDLLLDGAIRRVELDRTPWHNAAAFRALVYREADTRRCLARTHQAQPGTVLVRAWGTPELEAFTPNLKGPKILAEAPVMPSLRQLLATLSRSKPQPSMARPPTTSSAQVLAPAVNDSGAMDLGDDTIEDLLPPCTCGLGLQSSQPHPPTCRVWG